MFSFMTEGAIKCPVLCLAVAQLIVRRLMTGTAVLVEHVVPVGHVCRHVRPMALLAIGRGQMLRMGRMTLEAFGFLAVNIMAIGTEEFRVFARMCLQLLDLCVVAGQAGRCNVTVQGDIEGCMGIGMTVEAPFKFKMGQTLMADAALGDVIRGRWTMARVTVGTVDFLV